MDTRARFTTAMKKMTARGRPMREPEPSSVGRTRGVSHRTTVRGLQKPLSAKDRTWRYGSTDFKSPTGPTVGRPTPTRVVDGGSKRVQLFCRDTIRRQIFAFEISERWKCARGDKSSQIARVKKARPKVTMHQWERGGQTAHQPHRPHLPTSIPHCSRQPRSR